MRHRATCLALTVCALFAACSGGNGSEPSTTAPAAARFTSEAGFDGLAAAVESARATWDDHGLTDYSFTLSMGCFGCPGQTQLLVRDNEVVAAVASGRPSSCCWQPVMEEIFRVLENAIDERYETISFTIDTEYGFPIRANLDALNIADEELRFSVTEFATPGIEPELSAE